MSNSVKSVVNPRRANVKNCKFMIQLINNLVSYGSGLEGGLIVLNEFSPSLVLSPGCRSDKPSAFSCTLLDKGVEFVWGVLVVGSERTGGSLGSGLFGGPFISPADQKNVY